MTPRVLAVIVSNEPSVSQTRHSLESQTIPPSRIVVADRTFRDRFVGVRVAKAINMALADVDLSCFDWFLRVDGDRILPPDWIEKSLSEGVDIVGMGGETLLIRTSAFMAVGARFPVVTEEDTALILKLLSLGFKRTSGPGSTSLRVSGKHYPLFQFIEKGVWDWKLGYEPIHAAYNYMEQARVRRNLLFLLGIFGYLFAFLSQKEKWDTDVAQFVFHGQVTRLAYFRHRGKHVSG